MVLAKVFRVFFSERLLYPICLVIVLAYKYFILVFFSERYVIIVLYLRSFHKSSLKYEIPMVKNIAKCPYIIPYIIIFTSGASLQLSSVCKSASPSLNLVTTTPPVRLDGLSWNFQEFFLKVSSCAFRQKL